MTSSGSGCPGRMSTFLGCSNWSLRKSQTLSVKNVKDLKEVSGAKHALGSTTGVATAPSRFTSINTFTNLRSGEVIAIGKSRLGILVIYGIWGTEETPAQQGRRLEWLLRTLSLLLGEVSEESQISQSFTPQAFSGML